MSLELVQFAFSHYNEKARWALDYKGLAHRRRSLLPGPHVPVVKRLTGKTETPVLIADGQVIAGSAATIDFLEAEHPSPALYPALPEWRRKALEVQRFFDEEIGAEARRAFFLEFLADGGYAARCIADAFGGVTRALYGLGFPITRMIMRKQMELRPEFFDQACAAVRRGLDFVAENAGPDGFLVGDAFSVADLTAASLLQLVAFPPEAMRLPEPRSKALKGWLERWQDHPGTAWVIQTYRVHRSPSAALVADDS